MERKSIRQRGCGRGMKKERGSVPMPGMRTGPGWGTQGDEKSGDVEPGGVPREAGGPHLLPRAPARAHASRDS